MLIERLAELYGVSARDVRAICHVAFAGPMSATRLAERLCVTRGAMTGIVRRLQEGGWLEVSADPDDGRRVVVSHTERAGEMLGHWVRRMGAEIPTVHGRPPHPTFPHDVAAVSAVLERHRMLLARLGPAEQRQLTSQ